MDDPCVLTHVFEALKGHGATCRSLAASCRAAREACAGVARASDHADLDRFPRSATLRSWRATVPDTVSVRDWIRSTSDVSRLESLVLDTGWGRMVRASDVDALRVRCPSLRRLDVVHGLVEWDALPALASWPGLDVVSVSFMCVCTVRDLTDAHVETLDAISGRLRRLHVCTCMSRCPDGLKQASRLGELGRAPPGLRLDGGVDLLAALGLSRASTRGIRELDLVLYDEESGASDMFEMLRSYGMSEALETLRIRIRRHISHALPAPGHAHALSPAFAIATADLTALTTLELDGPMQDCDGAVQALAKSLPPVLRDLSVPRLTLRNLGSIEAIASARPLTLRRLTVDGFSLPKRKRSVTSERSERSERSANRKISSLTEIRCVGRGPHDPERMLGCQAILCALEALTVHGAIAIRLSSTPSLQEIAETLGNKLVDPKSGVSLHLSLKLPAALTDADAIASLATLTALSRAPFASVHVAVAGGRRARALSVDLVRVVSGVAPLVDHASFQGFSTASSDATRLVASCFDLVVPAPPSS